MANMLKTIINWKEGAPKIRGKYLVYVKDVGIDFDWWECCHNSRETVEGVWQYYNSTDILGWYKVDDIKIE